MSLEEWKDRYSFFDIHEVCFEEFHVLFFEWLKMKTTIRVVRISEEHVIWTKDKINCLENV